jgi:hypothetical protein
MLIGPAGRPALVVTTCIYVNVSFIPNKRVREKASCEAAVA